MNIYRIYSHILSITPNKIYRLFLVLNLANLIHSKKIYCFIIKGGANKSLSRPTPRCRRTESIVSLERGVCSCDELQVFSCYSE